MSSRSEFNLFVPTVYPVLEQYLHKYEAIFLLQCNLQVHILRAIKGTRIFVVVKYRLLVFVLSTALDWKID